MYFLHFLIIMTTTLLVALKPKYSYTWLFGLLKPIKKWESGLAYRDFSFHGAFQDHGGKVIDVL